MADDAGEQTMESAEECEPEEEVLAREKAESPPVFGFTRSAAAPAAAPVAAVATTEAAEMPENTDSQCSTASIPCIEAAPEAAELLAAAPESSEIQTGVPEPAAAPAAADQLTAEISSKLLRQIEYYFSDCAFPYDEFLQSQADESGAVPIATLAGSPRVLTLLEGMTEVQRAAAIGTIICESDSVVRAGERLMRRFPLPKADQAAPRSVYIAGLPKGADEEQLKTLMTGAKGADSFTPILSLRRLRDLQRDRSYTGQVFVELQSEEQAANLVRVANKGSIPCSKCKLLSDFFESQDRAVQEQRVRRAAKLAAGGSSVSTESKASGEGAGKRAREDETKPANYEAGLVLRFEGAGSRISREEVSTLCAQYGEVAYVEIKGSFGHVRFKKLAEAQAAFDALSSSGVELDGEIASWRKLTEIEEAEYYKEYFQRKKQRGGGGNTRGRGRGRFHWRGRGGSRST